MARTVTVLFVCLIPVVSISIAYSAQNGNFSFACCLPLSRTAMPGAYVKKEKLKVKQETTDTANKVKVHCKTNDDVIVICDTDEIVVIDDVDIDGSDLPAGADDTNGGIPAWEWCGSCETYPESGTCAKCGTMYHRCDPSADDFLNTDLVINHLELPLDLIKSRM